MITINTDIFLIMHLMLKCFINLQFNCKRILKCVTTYIQKFLFTNKKLKYVIKMLALFVMNRMDTSYEQCPLLGHIKVEICLLIYAKL